MPDINLLAWYFGATVMGLAFAYLISVLFALVVKPGSTGEFMRTLRSGLQELLLGEDDQFWSQYKRLLGAIFKYVGRQLGGVALAFAPLIIAMLWLAPAIMQFWEQDAAWVVVPESAGQFRPAETGQRGYAGREILLSAGPAIALPAEPGSVALCAPGDWSCWLLEGFGFQAVEVASGIAQADSPVVVRAYRNDWNPLWPWLSDPEFLFFISLSLGSVLFILFKGNKGKNKAAEEKPAAQIGFMDNLMTQFATRNAALLQRIGDAETSLMQSKLAALKIDRPVFIAGLARSGTTILLEKLATLSGVATHRYRDFPFVMTPVFWNRYLALAGGRQHSAERPHQDGIEINRDSPDAFEEPIWQHFFPEIHDPAKPHVLDASVSNPEFEQFYRDHLQKILLIRKGTRYLSKGNYNLPRIDYLSKIFPDALFLVPVRHPLMHVQSLIRQQQLFEQYAADDPNSPDYLRAAGHYEFGVQRQPINLGDNSAARSLAAWESGQEALGYAIQWAEIYGHIAAMVATAPVVAERLRIVRFEDLCAHPEGQFGELLKFTALGPASKAAELAVGIKASPHALKLTAAEATLVWQQTQAVAAVYGYTQDPATGNAFSQTMLAAQQLADSHE